MASRVLYVLLILPIVSGNQDYAREGFMDHLSNGMKFATNFLGSESVALKVAEFVVRAFHNANNPAPIRARPHPDTYRDSSEETVEKQPDYNINEVPSTMSPLKHLVKLFGLRPNQISAVAVNALVFVAQMISTFLSGPQRPSRPYRIGDDPKSWILNRNSRKLQELLNTAKNESLINHIEDIVKQQSTDEDTSCIQLLICRITPFVSRMQKAVFDEEKRDYDQNVRGSAVLYRHLPTSDEINTTSDACEKINKDCDLNAL